MGRDGAGRGGGGQKEEGREQAEGNDDYVRKLSVFNNQPTVMLI